MLHCSSVSDAHRALTVYTIPVSNFGTAVKLGLSVKGVIYNEEIPPDGYGSAAYKEIVPMGTCPGLVLRNQGESSPLLVISESSVILEWMEESYPRNDPTQSLLFKGPEAARNNAAVRFVHRLHDLYLEPPLRALFPHMDPRTRNNDFVAEKTALFYRRLGDLEATRQAALDQHTAAQQSLLSSGSSSSSSSSASSGSSSSSSNSINSGDSSFGPYFFGQQCTFADCVLAPTLQMADVMLSELLGEPVNFNSAPLVGQYASTVSTLPPFTDLLRVQKQATIAWAIKKKS